MYKNILCNTKKKLLTGDIMTTNIQNRRKAAVKVADTLNKIEGVPVTDFAISLSQKWAKGEISGEEMKAVLIASHKKVSA